MLPDVHTIFATPKNLYHGPFAKATARVQDAVNVVSERSVSIASTNVLPQRVLTLLTIFFFFKTIVLVMEVPKYNKKETARYCFLGSLLTCP